MNRLLTLVAVALSLCSTGLALLLSDDFYYQVVYRSF